MIYDEPVDYIGGLEIYRDFSNPKTFYFLPPTAPRIARVAGSGDTGDYALRLVLFRPDPEAAPPQGMEEGGGFLNLDVDLDVTEAKLDQIEQELQGKHGDDVNLVPVPFTEGSVELVLLGTSRSDENQPFVRKIAGSAVPSLYGSQRASFSVVLDRNGAALMRQVIAEGGVTMALAIYHLKYAAIGPAYNLEITIDYSRAHEIMDLRLNAGVNVSSGQSKFVGKAGFHMLMEELKENRAIVVKELDPIPGEGGRSETSQQEINDIIGKLMGSTWFRPSLSQLSQMSQVGGSGSGSSTSGSSSSSSSSSSTTAPTRAPTTAPTGTPAPTSTPAPTTAPTTRRPAAWTENTAESSYDAARHGVENFTPATSGISERLVIKGTPTRVTVGGQTRTVGSDRTLRVDVPIPTGSDPTRIPVQIEWAPIQGEAPLEETKFHLFFGFDDPQNASEVTAYVADNPPGGDDRFTNHSRVAGGTARGPAALRSWAAGLANGTVHVDGYASTEADPSDEDLNQSLSGRRISVARGQLGRVQNPPGGSFTITHTPHGDNAAERNDIPELDDDPGRTPDTNPGRGDNSRASHRVAIIKGQKRGTPPDPVPQILKGTLSRPAGAQPSPSPSPSPTPTPTPRPSDSTTVEASFEINLQMIERREQITASYNLSRRKARIKEIHPQGQLSFDDADPESYIIEADGAVDFFQNIKLKATTTAVWDLDGIDSIQIQLRYGPNGDGTFQRRGEIMLSSSQDEGNWEVNVLHENGDRSLPIVYWYDYKVTVHYRQGVALGQQRGAISSVGVAGADSEGWIRSFSRNLVVHPRDVTPALTVNIMTGIVKYDLLKHAQVELSYGPYRQNLLMSADQSEHRLVIRPEAGLEEEPIRTSGMLYYNDGAQVPLPPMEWQPQELVVINEARENTLRVQVIMADPGDEFDKIQVQLRYDHGNRLVEKDFELTTHAEREEWAVRLEDPEARAWQYKLISVRSSGAIETTPWTDGENDQLIVGIQVVDVIPVQVTWLMPPPAGGLLAVKIDLAYDDDANDVHWAHSELINPGHSGSFGWSLAIKDRNLRTYRYRVTEFRASGVTEGEWRESDTRSLVLLPGM